MASTRVFELNTINMECRLDRQWSPAKGHNESKIMTVGFDLDRLRNKVDERKQGLAAVLSRQWSPFMKGK